MQKCRIGYILRVSKKDTKGGNMDKNRLRSVMVLFGDTSETLANYLGISQSAFSKKINEKSTAGFTQPEIMRIKEKYSLSGEDIDHIFFGSTVS